MLDYLLPAGLLALIIWIVFMIFMLCISQPGKD